MTLRLRFVAVAAPFLVLSAWLAAQQQGVDPRPPNAPDQKPARAGQTRAPEHKTDVAFDVVTVATGLQNPWAIEFLPDGRMLVTEKPGRLRVVKADGTLSEPVAGLPPVDARGQGGLLDVALDPRFATNRLIYWTYAEPQADGTANTAAARGRFVDDATAPRVEDVQVIFHQAPSISARGHYGSRLVFGRDGTLFVTMGDRQNLTGRMQAQNLDAHIGKVARINPDGSVPRDNPFIGTSGARPEIFSRGHRNIQAAALNPATGELWEVEHGARGGDELNIVRAGRDYGWPTITYGIDYSGKPIGDGITAREGMEQPIYYWDPVIAPSGMIFYTGSMFPEWKGNVFIGGMVSTNLVRLVVDVDRVVGEQRLLTDLQPARERIRDVTQGPDGAIYVVTDNAQGRVLKLQRK